MNSEERTERDIEDIVDNLLDIPMFILSLMMLILLIIDLTVDMSQESRRVVTLAQSAIWAIFVIEYSLRVFLADDHWGYIRRHWVDGLFVVIPFLRVLSAIRVARLLFAFRALNPIVLARAFVTTRRGLRELRDFFGKRSFWYVVAITIVVTLIGALFMFLVERDAYGTKMASYGDAVWFAVGIVSTVGNELYPVTREGRVIAAVLMVYGVGVFGYLAGTLASYFIHVDTMPLQQEGNSVTMTPEEAQRFRKAMDELNRFLARQADASDTDLDQS